MKPRPIRTRRRSPKPANPHSQQSTIPSFTLLLEALEPQQLFVPALRELADHLRALDEANAHGERLESMVRIVRWLRGTMADVPTSPPGDSLSRRERVRVRLFIRAMQKSPALRARFLRGFQEIVRNIEAVNLFAESGIPGDRGFLAELGDKALQKILPPPRDDRDSGKILVRFFRNNEETDILRKTPPDTYHQLIDLLVAQAPEGMWKEVERDFGDAFRLLAARVKAEGLAPKLRARGPNGAVRESPFSRLDETSEHLLKAWASGRGIRAAADRWFHAEVECREAIETIRKRLETDGVNVNIVFSLEVIGRSLTRMETMVDVIRLPHGPHRSSAIKELLVRVITYTQLDQKLGHVVGWNLQLLGRKITERSGKTGEHYIARDRKEYWHIWLAAAGGGIVTTFTAAFKLTLMGAGLALFQEGFMVGLDYALSFLALQAFGLILATKQPAMTAAALATITREHRGSKRIDEVISFTARITRSQLAAAVANVFVVAAGAYALDQAWRWTAGRPFLAESTATHVYTTLSPLNSGTAFYAALTGVILWLAALIGGWVENLSVYHRIPDGIRDHPR
ncbi:hypothetical protein EG829_14345, partial [bacterium]|nr:hypothetical protein [bacterium]